VAFSLLITCVAMAADKGVVVLANMKGQVSYQKGDGTPIAASNGDKLSEGYTIDTGSDGIVVLLFSNGSTLTLSPNTQIAIDHFTRKGEDKKPAGGISGFFKLKKEPTTSTTRLKLNYGEIVGHVKKLNYAKGSSFDVDTPVGAAGIRGTSYLFEIQDLTGGNYDSTFGVSEGRVVFTAIGQPPVDIFANKQLTLSMSVDVSGLASIIARPVASLPPKQAQKIETFVDTANKALAVFAKEVLSPPEPEPKDDGKEKDEDEGKEESKDEDKTDEKADEKADEKGEGDEGSAEAGEEGESAEKLKVISLRNEFFEENPPDLVTEIEADEERVNMHFDKVKGRFLMIRWKPGEGSKTPLRIYEVSVIDEIPVEDSQLEVAGVAPAGEAVLKAADVIADNPITSEDKTDEDTKKPKNTIDEIIPEDISQASP